MTPSYEAVMSLNGFFLKCVYRVGTKTHKVPTCESRSGVILKKTRGGHIDPPAGIGLILSNQKDIINY